MAKTGIQFESMVNWHCFSKVAVFYRVFLQIFEGN